MRNGGTLILGPRSGVKEEEGAIVDALLPGLLREVAGCHVEEYDAFSQVAGLEMRVRCPADHLYRAHGLADVLAPEGDAEISHRYEDHYYAGKPAVVRNASWGGPLLLRGDDHGAGRAARIPPTRRPAAGLVSRPCPICRSASR